MYDGEIRRETLLVRNTGDREVKDVWLVLPSDGAVWLDRPNADDDVRETLELPAPHHLDGITLKAGESTSVQVTMRHMGEGPGTVSVLVVFREVSLSWCNVIAKKPRDVDLTLLGPRPERVFGSVLCDSGTSLGMDTAYRHSQRLYTAGSRLVVVPILVNARGESFRAIPSQCSHT